MKKLMYLSTACLFLVFGSCEQRDTTEGYDDDGTTMTDGTTGDETTGTLFTASYEDLMEDKRELDEDLAELKTDRTKRAGQMTTEYDSLVNTVDERLQKMEAKANEYRNATDDQKERLKEEFDMLQSEASERIDFIKDTYKND